MQRWVISIKWRFNHNGAFDDELLRAIQEDVPLMAIAFISMGAFCALTLAKRDKVRSQSILGIGAVITIFLRLGRAGWRSFYIIGENLSLRYARDWVG